MNTHHNNFEWQCKTAVCIPQYIDIAKTLISLKWFAYHQYHTWHKNYPYQRMHWCDILGYTFVSMVTCAMMFIYFVPYAHLATSQILLLSYRSNTFHDLFDASWHDKYGYARKINDKRIRKKLMREKAVFDHSIRKIDPVHRPFFSGNTRTRISFLDIISI